MYLSILILPLLGSIVSGFLGRKLGVKGSQIITTTCVVLTTLLAIIVFSEVSLNHIPVSIHLFRWIDSESLMVNWGFNFDSLTVSMLIPVLIVSSLVHLYSIGYMSHDPHNQRFFSYLSLFTFMMIILVTGNNYLLMFVGWEGVGVCSYLLVSFWFTRIAANQSSLAAFLTNRVGDCFLTIGMFALLLTFGNINYSTIFSLSPYISEDIITLIGILLLLGAMAKSSQIGLHVWLPMAMEGPTPVSALIHAATMVTAGVYLLMRSSPLIEYSSTVLLLCLWIGAITTVFSSLIGLFQQDIKKVIAYSTMSQLGMMVIAVGLSSYNLALFHLVNHAFYKALLFLGAGSVIHAVADNQDFRKYGGLRAFLPLTYSVMLIASLSLVAFPFMTGFYSKDFILESAYGNFSFSTTSVYFIATIGAMFTTLYSVKVLYLTFLTNPNGPQSSYKIAHEGDIYMSLPLIILAIFSIVFGYLTKDLFIGLGSDIFSDNSIFIHPNNEITLDTEFAVPVFFKLLPLVFTISLSLIYIIFSEFITKLIIDFKFSRFGYNFYSFFNQRFLIEAFYNKYITNYLLYIGGITTKVVDKGFIELIGPYGLEKALYWLGAKIETLSTNVVTTYGLYIVYSAILLLCLYSLNEDFSLNLMFLVPLAMARNGALLCSNGLTYPKSLFSTRSYLCMDNNGSDNDQSDHDSSDEISHDSDSGFGSTGGDTPPGTRIGPTDGSNIDDSFSISYHCRTRDDIDQYFKTKYDAMSQLFASGKNEESDEDHIANMTYLNQQKYDILDEKGLLTAEDERLQETKGGSVWTTRHPELESQAGPSNILAGTNNTNSTNSSLLDKPVDAPESITGNTDNTTSNNIKKDDRLEKFKEETEHNTKRKREDSTEATEAQSKKVKLEEKKEEQVITNTKRKREDSTEATEATEAESKKVKLDEKKDDSKSSGSNSGSGPDSGSGPHSGSGPDSGSGPVSTGGASGGADAGGNSGADTGTSGGSNNNVKCHLLDEFSFIDNKINIISTDYLFDSLLHDCGLISDYNYLLVNPDPLFCVTRLEISSDETYTDKYIKFVLDIIHELIWFF